ncbi:periphilin-1-like [Ctenodactylus gundi]
MLHIDDVFGNSLGMAEKEMFEGRYDSEKPPRERVRSRSPPGDGDPEIVTSASKKPLLLEKQPPLLEKKPPLPDRPGERSYSKYYSHFGKQEHGKGCSFSHDRKSSPPHRRDESRHRWTRDDHSASRHPKHVDVNGNVRRKSYYSSHLRDRSYKRNAPYFRDSPVSRKDSALRSSGLSVSSRSYNLRRSKVHSIHQCQCKRPTHADVSYKRQNKGEPARGEEISAQPLKTSRDIPTPNSSAIPSSKELDKPSRVTEKEHGKAAAEKLEKSGKNKLPDISEFKVKPTTPLFIIQPEQLGSDASNSTVLFEDYQLNGRSKAIASKTKEIEQVYRQDCAAFVMVVKMLVEKDPSLKRSIQFALRQNLRAVGERCVEELKRFIAEYDSSIQDFEEPF